jgi:hypothetical protein
MPDQQPVLFETGPVTKTCNKCGKTKPIEEFHRQTTSRRHYACNDCRIKYANGWRKRSPEKARRILRRTRLKEFGLTEKDYNTMLALQGGVCAICKMKETMQYQGITASLAVDHDHESGAVRGLLCGKCNRMLGFANDSHERLTIAAEYLKKHKNALQM